MTSTAAGEYADVIKNAYKARTATQIINAVQFHPSAVEKQIGETVNALEALQEDDRPKAKSLSEIVDEMAPGCFVDRERDFLYTGFTLSLIHISKGGWGRCQRQTGWGPESHPYSWHLSQPGTSFLL